MIESNIGTRITATDVDTGDTETRVIVDDYVLITDGTAYLDSIVVHSNGTRVIVVKGCKNRD